MLVCCLIIIYHIKIKSTFNLYRNIIWLWPEIILTFRMKVIFQTRQWDDPFSIWWSYITIMWCNQSCNSVMHHKELRSPPLPFYIWWLPCCDIQDEDLRFISNILRLFPDSRKFFVQCMITLSHPSSSLWLGWYITRTWGHPFPFSICWFPCCYIQDGELGFLPPFV